MESSETGLTYPKMAGFATTHGQEFEWTLAALLHLRGLNSDCNFLLGTNVKGAGAMDDIVFCLERDGAWRTMYVQLKHKESATVYRNMLTNPNGDFSLSKYVKSYLEIKEAMSKETRETLFKGSLEDCLFVIFTNAKGNDNLGEKRSESVSQAEEFLRSESGSVFSLEKDEDMLACLGDCGEDGRQFLKQLRVFCGQPSGEKLNAAVKHELRKMEKYKTKDLNIDRLCECYLGNFKAWWEKRGTKNDILHKGHNILESAFERVSLESELIEDKTRLLTTSEQTLKEFGFDLEFEVTALNKCANDLSTVSHVVSSEGSCRLTLTKLWQASEGPSLLIRIEHLIPYKRALLAECLRGNVKQLVVFADKGWPSDLSELYFEIVNEIVKGKNKCGVIFFSDKNNCQVSALTARFQGGGGSHADNFLFSQIQEVSRNAILEKTVKLQGHDTTLGELLSDDCKLLDQVFNASLIVEILRGEGPLEVGSALPEGIDYYVGRTLEQALCLKASVIQDLHGTVCIQITQSIASARGLLERALEFLSSLKDSPSFNHSYNMRHNYKVVQNPTETDSQGLIGPKSSFFSADDMRDTIHNLESTRLHPDLIDWQVFIESNFPSSRNGDLRNIINKLVQSPLHPDENDCQVSIGTKFAMGLYDCNFVGLRFGQENAVTALRVCSSKQASQQVSFLFVGMDTNEDDINKLTEFHDVRHLLDFKDGQLRWIRSHGGIESIRKHIDEDQVSRFAPETAVDVEDRLVLICAEPGMGKSTLMARLAKNTKAAHPHYFVILIALNDHTKLFAQGKNKDALEFLSIAAKMNSPLQRSLLKFALEVSGNVVVIADGFDEIAPRYVKECCHFLSRLLEETKARKIWMTSRNSVKQTIETHFSKLSARLREFDAEAQNNFFKSFWNKKSKFRESELDKFIDDLLEKSSKTIKEKEKNWLGIPLQCQMLAEVFEDHVNGSVQNAKLPDKLDLLSLLEMFVVKKCKVYVENKLKISCDDTNYDDHFEDAKKKFIDSHSKAGLALILGEDGLKTLGLEQVIKDWSAFCKEIQLGKDKTGFVDVIVDDKPRFIHRVFAEYFVAKWISQHLADSAELIKSKMFTDDFAVIRHIFNGILCKGFALHTAVLQENEAQVNTLLESEDVEAQDGEGRTALHLAAGLGTSENQKENTRRGKILDLIIGKTSDFKVVDILFGSPLRYADMTRTWVAIDRLLCQTDDNRELGLTLGNVGDENMLDTIFQQDLDQLLELCLDNGLEVEHRSRGSRLLVRACHEGSFKVTSLLIERNADINEIEDESASGKKDKGTVDVKSIKVDGEEEEEKDKNKEAGENNKKEVKGKVSPLIAASSQGHLKIVKLLLQKCVSKVSLSNGEDTANLTSYFDPSKYINMKSWKGRTAVHYAAMGGNEDVIRFLLGQGGDPQSHDLDNRNPLHLAARSDRPNAVRVLLQVWDEPDRDKIGGMTLQEYMDLKDEDGDTAIHLAACEGAVECVKILFQAGGKFSEKGFNGQTLLMTAAREGMLEVVEWLLENFNKEKEGMTLQEYTDLKDDDGDTAIHIAAGVGSVECVKILVKAGENIYEKGFNGRTPLMTAAGEGKLEVVEWLLDNFNKGSEGMTLQEYIDLKDKDGNTVINLAALGGSVKCVNILVQAGGNISGKELNGRTPLMIAAMEGKIEVVNWLLDNFNAEREGITLQEYIELKDKDGNTAIHIASMGGSVECVHILLQFGRYFSKKGFNGQTPLMIGVVAGKQEVVKWLLDNYNADREGKTLQEYIDLKNNDCHTAIHLAAWGGFVECVKILVQAGGNNSEKGFNGLTPLIIAAREGRLEVVEWLLDNYNADREGKTLQVYIDLKNNDCTTAIQHAAWGGFVECVKILVQAGGNISKKGFNGQTPLIIAAREGRHEVVEWLLDNFNAEREGMTLQEYMDMKDIYDDTAIHLAAVGGSVECFKILVQAGGNISDKGFKVQTPLMKAASQGKQEVVQWLLDNFNAEREGMTLQEYIDLKDMDGFSVIHLAAWGGSVICVKNLIQAGGNISKKGFNGQTPLIIAAREGRQEVVEWLLNNFNAEREAMTLQEYIDLKNIYDDTAIHLAAWGGSVECFKILVQAGGNISEKGFKVQTPLMKAASQGKQKVVQWLLDNFNTEREGMTLQEYMDVKDKDGCTVIHLAAWGGSVECFKILVQAGGNISEKGFKGQTPLIIAAREGRQELVECLLDNFNVAREGMTLQEYIDLKDIYDDTAIQHAAWGGSVECVRILVQAGGNISEKGFNGLTPLMIAAMEGKLEVVEWLLDNSNAEREGMTLQEYICLKDMNGNTAIYLAAGGGFVECVKILVLAGGNISEKGFNGRTPLMIAAMVGKLEVVEWLLDNFNAEREGMTLQEYIDLMDSDCDTALHFAAYGGFSISLSPILQAGGRLSEVGWNGQTPLMTAAMEGRQEVVKGILVNFNAKSEGMTLQEYIDMMDGDGDTVIHIAVLGCSVEFVKTLVKAGGNLSVVDSNGQTPLMLAAWEGRQEMVKWLLGNFNEKGEGMTVIEYIHIQDNYGDTVLHIAAMKGSLECIKLLYFAGMKLSQVGWNGESLLMASASSERLEVVTWLLDNFDADWEGMSVQEFIGLKSENGDTVMHLAAWGCSLGFLNCLVDAGGKMSEVGLNGETPLMIAAREGRQEVVEWLSDNFNDEREGMTLQEYIDITDKDGHTVIHFAGLKCSVALVKLLLEAAGRLPQFDSNGRTPLMIAAREGRQEVVEWLLDNFNEGREGMTLQEYIDITDKDGRTVLFWAGSKIRKAIENFS